METQTKSAHPAEQPKAGAGRSFPDPSLALVEFGDCLGFLITARTERDAPNRRIILKKVAYVRLEPEGWGGTAYPEIHVQQNEEGLFMAVEPRTGKVLRHPSRPRYEIAFISKDIFECAIQCIKERKREPLCELVAVTFGTRQGFSLEAGNLLAPEDYAAERTAVPEDKFLSPPPRFQR